MKCCYPILIKFLRCGEISLARSDGVHWLQIWWGLGAELGVAMSLKNCIRTWHTLLTPFSVPSTRFCKFIRFHISLTLLRDASCPLIHLRMSSVFENESNKFILSSNLRILSSAIPPSWENFTLLASDVMLPSADILPLSASSYLSADTCEVK